MYYDGNGIGSRVDGSMGRLAPSFGNNPGGATDALEVSASDSTSTGGSWSGSDSSDCASMAVVSRASSDGVEVATDLQGEILRLQTLFQAAVETGSWAQNGAALADIRRTVPAAKAAWEERGDARPLAWCAVATKVLRSSGGLQPGSQLLSIEEEPAIAAAAEHERSWIYAIRVPYTEAMMSMRAGMPSTYDSTLGGHYINRKWLILNDDSGKLEASVFRREIIDRSAEMNQLRAHVRLQLSAMAAARRGPPMA